MPVRLVHGIGGVDRAAAASAAHHKSTSIDMGGTVLPITHTETNAPSFSKTSSSAVGLQNEITHGLPFTSALVIGSAPHGKAS
jgi:hypothetical protein